MFARLIGLTQRTCFQPSVYKSYEPFKYIKCITYTLGMKCYVSILIITFNYSITFTYADCGTVSINLKKFPWIINLIVRLPVKEIIWWTSPKINHLFMHFIDPPLKLHLSLLYTLKISYSQTLRAPPLLNKLELVELWPHHRKCPWGNHKITVYFSKKKESFINLLLLFFLHG